MSATIRPTRKATMPQPAVAIAKRADDRVVVRERLDARRRGSIGTGGGCMNRRHAYVMSLCIGFT